MNYSIKALNCSLFVILDFLGATSHFFGLALSFWVMCFIANTYAVLVRERRGVFKHPTKIHFQQSLLCWLGPAVIVAGCLFIAPPGYKFVLVDLLAVGTKSFRMAYFAVTLPMQVTLEVSLSLLWSIIWHLRNVSEGKKTANQNHYFLISRQF